MNNFAISYEFEDSYNFRIVNNSILFYKIKNYITELITEEKKPFFLQTQPLNTINTFFVTSNN